MPATMLVETDQTVKTGLLEIVQARRLSVSAAAPEVAIKKPLQQVVEDTLTAAARSKNTARLYARSIAEFVALLASENGLPELVEVHRTGNHQAAAYCYPGTPAGVLRLVDAGLLDKFSRANPPNALYAVRTFLSVAYRDGVLTDDQARALGVKPYKARTPRKRSEAGRILTVLEVQLLRGSVDLATPLGIRDRAILDVMLYAGLRRAEVAGLRLDDFTTTKGRLHIRLLGKGDKVRLIPLHPELFDSLAAWLEISGGEFGQDGPLFCSFRRGGHPTGRALRGQNVADLVADYGVRSGLATARGKTRLGAHDLRRTFARRLYDQGAPLPAIQKLLGHQSPDTTITYLKLDHDAVNGVIDLLAYN